MSEIVPNSPTELGNTTEPIRAKKQDSPSAKWIFVVPIDPENDIFEQSKNIRQQLLINCKNFIFQAEEGASGYKHFQGRMTLHKKMRFTALKKIMGDKAHLEKEKCEKNSSEYCQKTDTRILGPWTEKAEIRGLIKKEEFYDWQKEVYAITETLADSRNVYWFWESEGNRGKSAMSKWLILNRPETLFIDEGRKADIMHYIISSSIENWENPLIIFDVPRQNCELVSYKSIESLKNGMIFSPKYESGMKIFNTPHIIVFANFPPNTDKLSQDRWQIKEI